MVHVFSLRYFRYLRTFSLLGGYLLLLPVSYYRVFCAYSKVHLMFLAGYFPLLFSYLFGFCLSLTGAFARSMSPRFSSVTAHRSVPFQSSLFCKSGQRLALYYRYYCSSCLRTRGARPRRISVILLRYLSSPLFRPRGIRPSTSRRYGPFQVGSMLSLPTTQ